MEMTGTIDSTLPVLDEHIDQHQPEPSYREHLVHLADVYSGFGDGHDPDPDISWLEPEADD